MATDYGFGALNKKFNNKNISSILSNINLESKMFFGRVTSINLEPSSNNILGQITFTKVDGYNPNDISSSTPNPQSKKEVALPFLSNVKKFPLVNEIVFIIESPNSGIQSSIQNRSLFYMDVVNIWNHPHLNAIPYTEGNKSPSQQKGYSDVFLGNTSKTPNNSTSIFLGNTFKEKSNIHPLLPFEGDYILEGRWGNSIRFGSTVNGLTNWSQEGEDGDPIVILRNGQGSQSDEGFTPYY